MTFALRAVARLLKMRKQSEKTTKTVNKEENSTSDFTAAIFSALQLAVCLKSLFNSFIGLDHDHKAFFLEIRNCIIMAQLSVVLLE